VSHHLCDHVTGWRHALALIADQQYANAALLYAETGSRPLAADAHLLAADKATAQNRRPDADRHARAVLALAEQADATHYEHQAERFLEGTA